MSDEHNNVDCKDCWKCKYGRCCDGCKYCKGCYGCKDCKGCWYCENLVGKTGWKNNQPPQD